ncbi:hypothetical protein B0H11DRAFT_2182407 [Mycena galericulata]|nr:hypothetical protein B0H11DRAFT_2182407 [Mycena galericulata]
MLKTGPSRIPYTSAGGSAADGNGPYTAAEVAAIVYGYTNSIFLIVTIYSRRSLLGDLHTSKYFFKILNDAEAVTLTNMDYIGLSGICGIGQQLPVGTKHLAADIYAIDKLRNPGWNGSVYSKYSKRSETFHPPIQELPDIYPLTYETKFHGPNGPIHTTILFHFHTIDELFQKTIVSKRLEVVKDSDSGKSSVMYLENLVEHLKFIRSLNEKRNHPNLVFCVKCTLAPIASTIEISKVSRSLCPSNFRLAYRDPERIKNTLSTICDTVATQYCLARSRGSLIPN